MQIIKARSILSPVKGDYFFGTSYNMNLYRGCQHACIYCDSRSACYKIANFDNIEIKGNAIELLAKELASKKKKGTVGFGSMNDPYMPIEKEQLLVRKALDLIYQRKFPAHIITKSDLVCRDIDLLQKIGKIYSAVTFSIITPNDELAKTIEPSAPLPSERFNAIKKLNEAGIYTGIAMIPTLPFITDNIQNIGQLIDKAKESGAQYILPSFGVTLREGSREHFYKHLKKSHPSCVESYKRTFGLKYECTSPDYQNLKTFFNEKCQKEDIPTKLKFYNPNIPTQLSMF